MNTSLIMRQALDLHDEPAHCSGATLRNPDNQ